MTLLMIQVQKKLNFFVDESVANYLALMDGLLEATRNNIKRVFAFTESPILFDQVTKLCTIYCLYNNIYVIHVRLHF